MGSESPFRESGILEDCRESAGGGGASPSRESGGRSVVYLYPGQFFASSEPCAVTTILGSCVAVCLWDSLQGVGGVNHYLLPYCAGNGYSSSRFGNVAVERLIEKLLALGSQKKNLQAKLFGGACVLEDFRKENNLGMKNIQVARKLLGGEGIPVVGEDVGGRQGRKLIFHTDEGTAWVKRL